MKIDVDINYGEIYIQIYKYDDMITIQYYDKFNKFNNEVSIHFEEKIRMNVNLPSKCIKNTIKLMATKKIKQVVFIDPEKVDKTAEGAVNFLVSILQDKSLKQIDIKYLKDIVRFKTMEINKANKFLSNIEKINAKLKDKIEKLRNNHIKIKNSYSKKLEKFPKDIEMIKDRIKKMKIKDTNFNH